MKVDRPAANSLLRILKREPVKVSKKEFSSMRVGLITPSFNPHDAVGNDVLGMYTAISDRGDEPIIFSPTGESDSLIDVMHYADATLLLGPLDVAIYHYCVADPVGMALLRKLSCRIIIRYHNVTPASLMSRWSSEFGRTCKLGRTFLADLPNMAIDGYLAASAYNAAELSDAGIKAAYLHVVPPFHKCKELLERPDDPATERLLEKSSYNVLAVGRVVPNKGFDLMAESFAKALNWGSLDIRLHHVGSHDGRLQNYIDRVGEVLADNGVFSQFTFHGQVSSGVLATLYRNCDLFWTTSLHEGFCVPAVEAMAFGLPILSSQHSALPETCGDAAVYATGIDNHAVRLHEILSDDFARKALGRTGRKRYEANFRPAQLRSRFLDALDAILSLASSSVAATSLDSSGEWFGLPRAAELLEAALPLAPDLPVYGLSGLDRRRDLVDWALREGPAVSDRLSEYACSSDLSSYALNLEMPKAAAHFGKELRLIWAFHRPARARFDLQSAESASSFWSWCQRAGTSFYRVSNTSASAAMN